MRLKHLWPTQDQIEYTQKHARLINGASNPATNKPSSAYEQFQRTYRDDPVAFVHDAFTWHEHDGPTDYQEEILTALPTHHRVSARGPRGLGKTALNSWLLLWFALTRDGEDWKIVSTAGAWRQVTKFAWPEVHKWARRLRWDRIGREPFNHREELLQLSLKLRTGEAFAVVSDVPDLIEGAHADCIFYIFDESKSIGAETFDAAEGAFSGTGEVFAIADSTPGEPQGRFYDIQRRAPGYDDWWVRRVTLDEAIAAGRISPAWAEQRKAQWGEGSQVYQNHVAGEFAASDEDGVIPLAWVEAANDRWRAWDDAGRPGSETMAAVGVDVSDTGGDKTVLAPRYGDVIGDLRYSSKEETMETAGRVKGILTPHPDARAIVDVIGIGAGVVSRLREMVPNQDRIVAFNASGHSDRMDRTGEFGFLNCLTGDARVAPIGQILRIYRSRYDGLLFRIQMSSGDDFTATANHNVLTHRGWIAVNSLNIGDQLCNGGVGDRNTLGHPEVHDMPPTISEVYRAARESFGSQRITPLSVDFHGDRPVGEVEVVTINRQLLMVDPVRREACTHECFGGSLHRQRAVSCSGGVAPGRIIAHPTTSCSALLARALLLAQSVGVSVFTHGNAVLMQNIRDSPARCVERINQGAHGLPGTVTRDQCVGVNRSIECDSSGLTPWVNTVFMQDATENVPITPEMLAERVQRLSAQIPGDYVIGIDIISAHGDSFVYTLETSTGAYRTASITHRNCRAEVWWGMRERLDPSYGPTVALPPDDLLTGDLTAPHWKVTSGGKIQIESKEQIRKRIERSTDAGDAVVQAFAVPPRHGNRGIYLG